MMVKSCIIINSFMYKENLKNKKKKVSNYLTQLFKKKSL